jgi:methylglutaconyl-CoA hydratase
MSSLIPPAAVGAVSSSVSGGIATIEFGGTKGNSLPAHVLAALAAEVTRMAARDDVRVMVLRTPGYGPFCAGASFDELTRIADPAAGKEFFLGFARVILAMTGAPQPVITRVQGKAVGGGVGIVAASDYAMAVDGAAIRLSELAVGIGPFVVGPAIEHKVGRGAYGALALDADWRSAQWAAQHGLYARLLDSEAELDVAVEALAARLAAANPEAVRRIKRVTWAGTEHWPQLLDQRAADSGELVLSEFTRNAIREFQLRA